MGNDIEYFAHPAISNSKLGWYEQSPAHYKYFMEHGKEDRPAYLVGSASHTILFEPDTFAKKYHQLDESKKPYPEEDYRNAANKKWKKEMLDAYAHKIIISVKEYDMIMFMMEVIQKNDQAQEILKGAVYEQEFYWKDPITGIELKKKVDIVGSGYQADYKTTDNADPYTWQKKAWRMDYYRQAGFYSLDETVDAPKEFWFIAQEKTPPYGVSVHKCTRDMINYGKDRSNMLLGRIKSCMDQDYWPSYEIKTPVDSKNGYFDFDIPGYVLQNM